VRGSRGWSKVTQLMLKSPGARDPLVRHPAHIARYFPAVAARRTTWTPWGMAIAVARLPASSQVGGCFVAFGVGIATPVPDSCPKPQKGGTVAPKAWMKTPAVRSAAIKAWRRPCITHTTDRARTGAAKVRGSITSRFPKKVSPPV